MNRISLKFKRDLRISVSDKNVFLPFGEQFIMTAFVAHTKVDMLVLPEIAALTSNDVEFQFASENVFVAQIEDVGYVLSGEPEIGIIKSVSVIKGGNFAYQFADMSLEGENDIHSVADVLAILLKGRDEIVGSNRADRLVALGGNDEIEGRGGDDVISGGDGADRLEGGSGDDTFLFDFAPSAENDDKIKDFNGGHDLIALDRAVFADIGGKGVLDADRFHEGSGAEDAGDRIIYNPRNGTLLFDPDGKGGADAIKLATLAHYPNLDHHNFLVV